MSEPVKSHRFIQNIDLLQVCEQFGTPLYVYDADKIVEQIGKLRLAFDKPYVKLKYAAKSLTNQAILKLVKKQRVGLDVVSIQEARLGMKAGFTASEIMYTPSGVSFKEIQEAIELGVQLNLDNLSLLEDVGKTYGHSVPCCLRLNPNLMAGGNAKISVGHNRSKFGIPASKLEDIQRLVATYHININGLHIHTGSDIVDVDVFMAGAELLFNTAIKFPDLQFIDFGSGFKVPYKPADKFTKVDLLGERLIEKFEAFCKEYGRPLEMWFEPGKFIVSESGYLLAQVNVVKQNPGVTFVGLNTGLNHLIRPMMYDAHHEIVNISNPEGTREIYDVVGYICETDTFASNCELSEVRRNDVLAILNAGAYGFSMASNYNGRFRPAEVLIYQGKPHLIRKRESFEDLLRNQIEINL